MAVKKIMFCFSFLAIIKNSAEEGNLYEDNLNEEISSKAVVEDNVFINENSWNTRKWGSIYFLFPQLRFFNIIGYKNSIFGLLDNSFSFFLNIVLSCVVEYKYMFQKCCGINIRLNLNNMEAFYDNFFAFLSIENSIEWIYGIKGKRIFSGSFSPFGFAFVQKENGSCEDDFF